ncbi:MAG: 16S rRNA (guanine(966)-N(2))-methyltransferase RsmD [Deltaproteobacteria bacterium]|nr:16S rRNA (guanine(966)-N(2))-methyltransferase RsmD [Deltaproteobacteria bacterium]
MKITGGSSRGKSLVSLNGMEIRPTSSKVREAIFNILGQDLTGFKVLDLFAGTGILGIEAMSRGAEAAVFIDKSDKSIKTIVKNLSLCGYGGLCRVLKRDLTKRPAFESLEKKGAIDLVFIDPPYRKEFIPPVLMMLSGCGVLSEQAFVVTESSKNDTLPESAGEIILCDSRIYGETRIDIFRKGY